MIHFQITLLQSSDYHQDIQLTLGNETIIADSYWLRNPLSNNKLTFEEAFVRNLFNWKNGVPDLPVGEVSFLPINVSDQSTGFMVVKKLNHKGVLNLFYMDAIAIPGHSIDPWYNKGFKVDWCDFFSIRGGSICDLPPFLESVEESIDRIRQVQL